MSILEIRFRGRGNLACPFRLRSFPHYTKSIARLLQVLKVLNSYHQAITNESQNNKAFKPLATHLSFFSTRRGSFYSRGLGLELARHFTRKGISRYARVTFAEFDRLIKRGSTKEQRQGEVCRLDTLIERRFNRLAAKL